MTQPSPSSPPTENLQRGVVFALIALPLGVVAWDIIWSFGFVASIVALGIAYLALRLYRVGSGGRVSRNGAIAVTVITIGTLVIAFISGFAVDLVGEYSRITGASIPESLVSSRFWGIVFTAMSSGQALLSLLLAAVFGLLGCFGILRATFRQTAAGQTTTAQPGSAQPTLIIPSPANPADAPAVPAPPAAQTPAAPSSGVVLNGEQIAPDERDTK